MGPRAIVRQLLAGRSREPGPPAAAWAPANLALCKYWGKRDARLNLPVTASLSISLGPLGTNTEVRAAPDARDDVSLNDRRLSPADPFCQRLSAFLDLFRPRGLGFRIATANTMPTGAGVASSASGFAALTLALNDFFGWELDRRRLSILARLGSGSACRSLYDGFVLWRTGRRPDGLDSVAVPLAARWPDLRVGLVLVTAAPKPVSSRAAMAHTVRTAVAYRAWPARAAADLRALRRAIAARDFARFGAVAESNALAMHGLLLDARPPALYWQPGTVAAIRRVWALRADGVPVYLTIDAGPNVKLLFPTGASRAIRRAFPAVRIVSPFAGLT